MKRIILTGGGTAGHVTPNIALIPELKKRGFEIHYIGSKTGIEKELIGNFDIPYYGISSGKLRRYFDVKNFTDPFRILKGYSEAKKLIKKIQSFETVSGKQLASDWRSCQICFILRQIGNRFRKVCTNCRSGRNTETIGKSR